MSWKKSRKLIPAKISPLKVGLRLNPPPFDSKTYLKPSLYVNILGEKDSFSDKILLILIQNLFKTMTIDRITSFRKM